MKIFKPNNYMIEGNYVRIYLTQEQSTLIDKEDYNKVKNYRWRTWKNKNHNILYAITNIRISKGKRKLQSMHRLIMNLDSNNFSEIDHVSGDGLDNRKHNLRICLHKENSRNCKKYKNGSTSKYKGVSWYVRDKKWRADIRINERLKYLGTFESELEASQAYNIAAKEHFGIFAKLNS